MDRPDAGYAYLRSGGWVGIWLALFVAMVFLVMFVDDPETAIRLVLGALTVGGLILVASGAATLRRRRGLPRVTVAPSEVEVGGPVSVGYAPGRAGSEHGVIGRLICTERVTFRPKGHRAHATDAHDWVVREAAGDAARGELALAVPPDAMHSFRSRHHQIDWAVEVEPKRRGARARLRIPIKVLAAVRDEP